MIQLKRARYQYWDGMLSTTLTRCSRWAEKRIWTPEYQVGAGDRPEGWYSFRDYPWSREILDSRALYNWVMKGAQTGLTTAGYVRAFHETDFYQNDTMYVMPTDKVAKLFSKTRLSNWIKLSPYLREVTKDSEEVKQIGFSCLYIRGANGDINIRSTPAKRLILDELDLFTERQLWQVLERMSGTRDKCVWGISTPGLPNTGIHKLFLNSTQEHFFFECPHCQKEIELIWPDSIHIGGKSEDDPLCAESYLKCYECQGPLAHEEKPQWLKNGFFKVTNSKCDSDMRGFQLSQLYSGTVSPRELVVAYHRGRAGDEDARREFFNSKLGLPFVEDGSQVTDEHINACIKGNYSRQTIMNTHKPEWIVTMGIDQGEPHYWVAVKWGLSKDRKVGDINDRCEGQLLGYGTVDQMDWSELYNLVYTYQALRIVIDYFPEPTPARTLARKFGGCMWLNQYVVGRSAREILQHEDDYGANISKVDKVSWLSKTLGRVMDGKISFPFDIDVTFRRQLKSLVRERKRDTQGTLVSNYVETGADHYAHALNYAEIALKILDPPLEQDMTIYA